MFSKVGSLAKPATQIWISEAMAKQLNLNKLSDTARSKDGDVRHSQKPTFENICVYNVQLLQKKRGVCPEMRIAYSFRQVPKMAPVLIKACFDQRLLYR